MWLSGETIEDIHDVDAETIRRVLQSDSFGGFVILSASDEGFIQAGNNWAATPECTSFMERNDSDPWILEYRDEKDGKLFSHPADVTLKQVESAFLSFLESDGRFLEMFEWTEVELSTNP